ncbi:MAG: SPOR domain-containing protein [Bacteroidaceae bacterium]|nr:SPOR domain-containing protein [Bacteroidaceae bacterium]
MRLSLTLILTLLCLEIEAQQSYTDRLQQADRGRGFVKINQSLRIADLVNGVKRSSEAVSSSSEPREADYTRNSSAPRIKMNGYRIQIYSGGNTRKNKQMAENAGYRVRGILADEQVYTNFISPRWVCRVGDYRSYEEAYIDLQTLKSAGGFNDAVIVPSVVQVCVE